MCNSDFSKIIVGEEEDRMILCRTEVLEKTNIKKVVKKAFPDLFSGFFEKVPFKITRCDKDYPSPFGCQVGLLEKNHEWEKTPFMALKIFKKAGEYYCFAKPVVM